MNDLAASGVIERAFQLARSGKFHTTSEVADALKKSGFARRSVEDHLSGKAIRKELAEICRAAHEVAAKG